MFNLIRNENMKIYCRVRTWIMIGLVLAVTIFFGIVDMNAKKTTLQEDWRSNVLSQIQKDKEALQDKNIDNENRNELESNLKMKEYRLQHNIPPDYYTLWGGVSSMSSLITLIAIFTIVIAGDITASEFGGGTIKLLLIRPASRSKILLSKFIATFLFALFSLVILFVSAFIINSLIYGFQGIDAPYLSVAKDGVVQESSILLNVLSSYAMECALLVVIVTFAFMLSSIFRSSALSIGLSIMMLAIGPVFNRLGNKFDWIRYWLFMNTDLTPYQYGKPAMQGMTLPFSITVLAVYFIIFTTLAWVVFNKRDIAA